MIWWHKWIRRERVRMRYRRYSIEYYCECGKVWDK